MVIIYDISRHENILSDSCPHGNVPNVGGALGNTTGNLSKTLVKDNWDQVGKKYEKKIAGAGDRAIRWRNKLTPSFLHESHLRHFIC